jgi:hypothetical protein
MALIIAHIDAFPEPQDGEGTIALHVSLAQPTKRGDAEGWRARATCAETGRVVGRWMGDCPLSVVQSALLWVGMYPWEVAPEEGGFDFAEIIDQAERPLDNDQIHVRDLLERIANNLPTKPTEVRNPASGARIVRGAPRMLPAPVEEEVEEDEEEGEVEDEDEIAYDEEEEIEEDDAAPVARGRVIARRNPAKPERKAPAVSTREAAKAETQRVIRKAIQRVKEGGDVDDLARAVERRVGREAAVAFLAAAEMIVVEDEEEEAVSQLAPTAWEDTLSEEARAELEMYTASEGADREKLARSYARAAREHDRIEKALAAKARREAEAAARAAAAPAPAPASVPTVATDAPRQAFAAAQMPNGMISLSLAPPEVVDAPSEPVEEVAAPKPRRGRKKAEATSEAAG